MKVSIITICFNAEDTIRETLNSVLSQDYSDIEYIIKDGVSTDNTLKILEDYRGEVSKVISKPDAGLYDAINQGIEEATGDVIGLIHADDVLATSKVISSIVNAFENNNTDAIYGDLEYVNKLDTSKVFRLWVSGGYKLGDFKKGWMPPHPTFYVKKETYKRFGLYNTDFKSAGDYELMLRFIHKERISLYYIPQVLVKMRLGGKSNASFKNRVRANIEDRKAWRINNLSPGVFTLFRKPLRKIKQFL